MDENVGIRVRRLDGLRELGISLVIADGVDVFFVGKLLAAIVLIDGNTDGDRAIGIELGSILADALGTNEGLKYLDGTLVGK